MQQKYDFPNADFGRKGTWSLTLKPEMNESLKEYYGKKTSYRLFRALLEILSIIAYSQPSTRAEKESIRGVNCAFILQLLGEKNLIQEVGLGRPLQYGTTREFLRLFGLKSISDLPKLDETERARFELQVP